METLQNLIGWRLDCVPARGPCSSAAKYRQRSISEQFELWQLHFWSYQVESTRKPCELICTLLLTRNSNYVFYNAGCKILSCVELRFFEIAGASELSNRTPEFTEFLPATTRHKEWIAATIDTHSTFLSSLVWYWYARQDKCSSNNIFSPFLYVNDECFIWITAAKIYCKCYDYDTPTSVPWHDFNYFGHRYPKRFVNEIIWS